jgi:hypothetical protein
VALVGVGERAHLAALLNKVGWWDVPPLAYLPDQRAAYEAGVTNRS